METTIERNGVRVTFVDDEDLKRSCGGCTLCCRLVPVPVLRKVAGETCRFARFRTGCTIHARAPAACRQWSCRWLVDPEVARTKIRRPDRTRYVIDIMPDVVQVQREPGAGFVDLPVLQIWNDPSFPDAHRDPALRAYLAGLGERERVASIVRFEGRAENSGLALIPPAMSESGEWIEKWATLRAGAGMWSGVSEPAAHGTGSRARPAVS